MQPQEGRRAERRQRGVSPAASRPRAASRLGALAGAVRLGLARPRSLRRVPAARSLRGRVLLLVAACLLPSAILFALAVLDARRFDAARAEAEALRLARLLDGQQERLLGGIEGVLRVVGLSRRVEGGDAEECAAYLRTVLAGNPALQNIVAFRPDGGIACSALPAPAGLSVADEPHFRRALEAKTFTVSG